MATVFKSMWELLFSFLKNINGLETFECFSQLDSALPHLAPFSTFRDG